MLIIPFRRLLFLTFLRSTSSRSLEVRAADTDGDGGIGIEELVEALELTERLGVDMTGNETKKSGGGADGSGVGGLFGGLKKAVAAKADTALYLEVRAAASDGVVAKRVAAGPATAARGGGKTYNSRVKDLSPRHDETHGGCGASVLCASARRVARARRARRQPRAARRRAHARRRGVLRARCSSRDHVAH